MNSFISICCLVCYEVVYSGCYGIDFVQEGDSVFIILIGCLKL